MASVFSFDIVSNFDAAEMNNVIDQARRELGTRYDFKGTSANVEFRDNNKTGIKITGDSEYHIEAILDIVRKKLASRGLSQKVLDTSNQPVTSNLKVSLDVPFKKGLDQEKAKKITSLIREAFPKVKPQIQGDEVRVSSAKKDELQAVMQHLEAQELDFPLQFTNYR